MKNTEKVAALSYFHLDLLSVFTPLFLCIMRIYMKLSYANFFDWFKLKEKKYIQLFPRQQTPYKTVPTSFCLFILFATVDCISYRRIKWKIAFELFLFINAAYTFTLVWGGEENWNICFRVPFAIREKKYTLHVISKHVQNESFRST